MSKSIKSALNLKQFLLRQEVLKLYKELYRTINRVPDEASRKDLKVWLREDFNKNKIHTDEIIIKMCMQNGYRSMKELKNSLELSGISRNEKK